MKYETIFDGTYLFPNALSEEEQNTLLSIYQKSQKQVYVPKLRSGYSMNLNMTCFGKHWSAVDYKYHDTRIDYDNAPVENVPSKLTELAAKFTEVCFPEYERTWDIAIMNYYGRTSTLGMHQDNSESKETLKIGHPVVSFSIGAGSIFRMGGLSRKASYLDLDLSGGDCLIFGALSRLRYHGIVKITDVPNRFEKQLNGGRVNFTLRKY